MSAEDQTTAALVAIARVEGKIDAYAARTGVLENRVDEMDARLRTAASEADLDAVDDRLRAIETRSVVTPTQLWSAAGVIAAAVTAVSPFLTRLYS